MSPRAEFSTGANGLSVVIAAPDDPRVPVVCSRSSARTLAAVTKTPTWLRLPPGVLQPARSTKRSSGERETVAETEAVGQRRPTEWIGAESCWLREGPGGAVFRVRDVTER